MDTFSGFRVVVANDMAGMKEAVRQGGTIFVSPAMYDLMKHATPAELKRLLDAIEVIELPEMDTHGWMLP